MSLSVQTVMALALQCAPQTAHPDELARVLTGIALQESRLEPTARHTNGYTDANGNFHPTSTDYGLMQVNSAHLGRPIGYRGHVITAQSLLDPCESIAAGGAILLAGLSTYNTGSPTRGMGYASRAVAAIGQVMDRPGMPSPEPGKPVGRTLGSQFVSFSDR